MTSFVPSLTISNAPPQWTASDWSALRTAGLAYVEQYAHDTWTDYNEHDPGITLLELLCYAITDLSARTALPVADVLRSALPSDAALVAAFTTANTALTTHPITVMDYRRLLLDVAGVRNAWLLPVNGSNLVSSGLPTGIQPPIDKKPYEWVRNESTSLGSQNLAQGAYRVSQQGLYIITVEIDQDWVEAELKQLMISAGTPNATPTLQQRNTIHADIRARVFERYRSYRNLGEDCLSVADASAGTFNVSMETSIDISPEADPVEVEAAVLLAVEQYLAPAVPRYSLEELLAMTDADGQPIPVEELLEGPLPTRGFTRPSDVQASDYRSTVYVSDVMSVVLAVPGVIAVRSLSLNGEPWQLSNVINPDTEDEYISDSIFKLIHSTPTAERPAVFQNRTQVIPDAALVKERYTQLRAERVHTQQKTVSLLAPPPGTPHDLTTYRPLALDLPATYGVAPAGLPANASVERRHLARQLQAYLLIFDQLLTNFLQQLQHAHALLTPSDAQKATYFGQALPAANLPTQDPLYQNAALLNDTNWLADPTQNAGGAPAGAARKIRFLDHLLARFAENPAEHERLRYTPWGPAATSQVLAQRAALAANLTRFAPSHAFRYDLPSWMGDDDDVAPPSSGGAGGGSATQTGDDFVETGGDAPVSNVAPPSPSEQNDKFAFENISGIVRRFGLLAGIPNFRARWTTLAKVPNTYGHYLTGNGSHLRYVLHHPDRPAQTYVRQIAKSYFAPGSSTQEQATRQGAKKSRELGRVFNNWVIKDTNSVILPDGEPYYFFVDGLEPQYVFGLPSQQLFSASDSLEVVSTTLYKTHEEAEAALRETVAALQAEEEVMFVVEHSLLRPLQDGPLGLTPDILPAATNPVVGSETAYPRVAEPRDPYSFRLSIVLPGYTARFHPSQVEYRAYAERLIRTELPAHIFARIYWVDDVPAKDNQPAKTAEAEMSDFEQVYHDWLLYKRTPGTSAATLEAAREALVAKLNSFRVNYPYKESYIDL